MLQTNANHPDGSWVQSSLLDLIDYADPRSPTIRTPVSIPGTLQGIQHQGELLYTTGAHWDTNQVSDWTQWLDASAYDGVAAHLVDSLAISNYWPYPVLVLETNVFIGRSGYSPNSTNSVTPRLETWSLSDAGKFTLNGSVKLDRPASTLLVRGGLLLCQETDNSLDLFAPSSPAALTLLRHDQPTGCLWYDLNNADGDLDQGVWLPLGLYGVKVISLSP